MSPISINCDESSILSYYELSTKTSRKPNYLGGTSFRDYLSCLRLPAIQAPMFRVSGPEMVIAACRSGIIGSFPAPNARTIETLGDWYTHINQATRDTGVPWAANVIVHPSHPRCDEDLAQVFEHQPPLVVTALGSPRGVIDRVHDYGGYVLADVATIEHARKAASSGADGLVLVCAGAGGYTGSLSPFAFVEEVRRFFDGVVVVGGAISTGRAIRAIQMIGADLAYVGSAFIACEESLAPRRHKEMVVNSDADDVIASAAITGATASWLRPSLVERGYDPDDLPTGTTFNFGDQSESKRWKDLWSAGQGIGAVSRVESVAGVVNGLVDDYVATGENRKASDL